MTLRYDRLAADRPGVVADDLSRVHSRIENVNPETRHTATVRVAALPVGTYSVEVDGTTIATVQDGREDGTVRLPMTDSTHRVALLQQE